MSITNDHLKSFNYFIQETVSHLKQLKSTLEEEQLALRGINPESLEASVIHKLELLKAIESSLVSRERLQHELQLASGLKGGGDFVKTVKQPTIQKNWDLLISLTNIVKELNLINGQMISQGQRTTKEALSILTGRETKAPVYTRNASNYYANNSYAGLHSLGVA